MLPKWSRVWALLCLVLCLNLVAAGPLGPYRRQDASPTTAEAPKTTQEGDGVQTTTTDRTEDSDISTTATSVKGSSTTKATTTGASSSSPTATAIPSAINGNDSGNSGASNGSPIAEGDLPLEPRLTPGWGVAGAILLISGVVYALIGIKNPWLHTFFSTAYLASLCVSVLIIYVMMPPVTDAIQGAYVVAVICSGLILGGAATVFKELTEGLGCLLGGFCFSMWLLTLKDGGLLPSTTGKVIFISIFTVVGFALYFSRYTRPYALIGLMSFAGATVTVLGIDCFSKAGLKEFWAYIWNLNDKLFPLSATTYPVTKGIRVEIAVIVVFTILGIISQLKLWRVVQQHRAKRAEERAEIQQMREEEEANVGRQIEADNARERRQWEATYGNHPLPPESESRDSGVGDIDTEKKGRLSQTSVESVDSEDDAIEMAELLVSDDPESAQKANQSSDGLLVANGNQDSKVTIRVAADDGPGDESDAPMPEPDEKAWMAGSESKRSSTTSLRNSQRMSNATGPEVVPLPFKVPKVDEQVDEEDDGDRSSLATFADEDEERSVAFSKRASGMSIGNRFSVGSGVLIRSLSQRSHKPKRSTGEPEPPQPSPKWGESREGLMYERRRSEDAGSIVATVDGMSEDGDNKMDSVKVEEPGWSKEITAELADRKSQDTSSLGDRDIAESGQPGARLENRAQSPEETAATDAKSKKTTTANAIGKTERANESSNPTDTSGINTPSETSKAPKSVSPSVTSSASLTKDRLPGGLSRVAMSYRTNEWAKHLSHAETPEPETLQLNEPRDPQKTSKEKKEVPAPVNVEELQQTPESGIPPTNAARSPSSLSNVPSMAPYNHSSSRLSLLAQSAPSLPIATDQIVDINNQTSPITGQSTKPAPTSHIFRNKNRRQSSDMIQPILEEYGDEHGGIRASPSPEEGFRTSTSDPSSPSGVETGPINRGPIPGVVSYNSPQTLLSKREMYIRNKSQSMLLVSPISEGAQLAPRSASQMTLHTPQQQPLAAAPPPPFAGSQDADDIPLSKRRELMRQNSLLSVQSGNTSMGYVGPGGPAAVPLPPVGPADTLAFNSHQPQRRSMLPPQAQRDAQLANFRQSVAVDLRAGTPVSPLGGANLSNLNLNGRETPLLLSASTTSLGLLGAKNGNHDVQRNIDAQRNMMLSQREQEAQRREVERWEKERNERAFEERMRRGDLMDAHREAMRKLQGGVKDR
ncbi:hypothetical protein F5B20DRAFT_479420 [Whalleya microplaca]|nr:hypothetical protein F5B20DRAFT_479420 [Whalleya microplaca]